MIYSEKMKRRPDWLLILIFLLPVACFAPKKTSTVKPTVINLSKMYNPTNTKFHPAFSVYHNSPTTTLLLVKIFPVELLYSGTIEPNQIMAQVVLNYVLTDIEDPEKPVVADSGKIKYNFARENADKRFITQIVLNTRKGKLYQLMILARDVVRNEENITYEYVDRTSDFSEQNFLLTEPQSNVPVFSPHVIGRSLFKIDYPDTQFDTVYVNFYGGEKLPMPRPSFSEGKNNELPAKPDSLWILPFRKGINYTLNYEGVYQFKLDSSRAEGLTLFNFGTYYPKVQEVNQLIEPLAYLSTTPEYDALKKSTNQKLAVDNFWIDKAGNVDKARELIKVYYNRVFFANFFFTSYKPGWKTDRGMIFIIYGPPQQVKVTPTQEKWIYFKNNFSTTVTFTFDYVPSYYSHDNYILQRSDAYDTYWRQAVDTWRKGSIFLID
jgi:GWxTD domain-containing protein